MWSQHDLPSMRLAMQGSWRRSSSLKQVLNTRGTTRDGENIAYSACPFSCIYIWLFATLFLSSISQTCIPLFYHHHSFHPPILIIVTSTGNVDACFAVVCAEIQPLDAMTVDLMVQWLHPQYHCFLSVYLLVNDVRSSLLIIYCITVSSVESYRWCHGRRNGTFGISRWQCFSITFAISFT